MYLVKALWDKTLYLQVCCLSLIGSALAATPAFAYSDVEDMTDGWSDGLKSGAKFSLYVIMAVGVIVHFYGWYLLVAGQGRQGEGKGKAIGFIVIGAIMAAGVAMLEIFSGTIVDGSSAGVSELDLD
jgi:hypothetical protein